VDFSHHACSTFNRHAGVFFFFLENIYSGTAQGTRPVTAHRRIYAGEFLLYLLSVACNVPSLVIEIVRVGERMRALDIVARQRLKIYMIT
jgi:hypothetical protein